jgi:hypothetical protein
LMGTCNMIEGASDMRGGIGLRYPPTIVRPLAHDVEECTLRLGQATKAQRLRPRITNRSIKERVEAKP